MSPSTCSLVLGTILVLGAAHVYSLNSGDDSSKVARIIYARENYCDANAVGEVDNASYARVLFYHDGALDSWIPCKAIRGSESPSYQWVYRYHCNNSNLNELGISYVEACINPIPTPIPSPEPNTPKRDGFTEGQGLTGSDDNSVNQTKTRTATRVAENTVSPIPPTYQIDRYYNTTTGGDNSGKSNWLSDNYPVLIAVVIVIVISIICIFTIISIWWIVRKNNLKRSQPRRNSTISLNDMEQGSGDRLQLASDDRDAILQLLPQPTAAAART